MKKATLFFAILLAVFTGSREISAQSAVFKQKTKQVHSTSIAPAGIHGTISGIGLKRNLSAVSQAPFRPHSFPAQAVTLSFGGPGKTIFDRDGRLIFASGKVPDAIPVGLKSSDQLASCYQYLGVLGSALKIGDPASEFVMLRTQTDDLGMTHFRMGQVYKGIPVWGGEAFLHTRGDYVDIFNGRVYPTPAIQETRPAVTAGTAVSTTVLHVSGQTSFQQLTPEIEKLLNYTQPISELVIYHKDQKPENARLAWHVTIRPNFLELWEYFIDAQNGEVLHFYNNTRSDGDVTATGTDLNGVNQTFHAYLQGGTYYLADVSKPMFNPQTGEGKLQIYDANWSYPEGSNFTASPEKSTNNAWEATAVSAIVNSSRTFDYFKNTFNLNSYNNQGASIPSIIHVGGETGPGFDNAFWNGQAIYYGDGKTYFKPLAGALDVAAHEHGHAYEGSASNLEYQNQSGALAETYADIAGSMVERLNWTIGEDVVKIEYFPTGCLRDMSNPHNGGTSLNDRGWQPAHVNEMYTGSDDNGGVHINSGIVNFAFYKIATAISKEKAERIFWRASLNYLTRTAQFADCRAACLQSAKDLFGDGSAEMSSVANSFAEVGIGEGTGGGGGGGGGAPGTLPVNPGSDNILCYDVAADDPNSLYIATIDGQNFTAISQTEVNNKPTILDDGSMAVFIDDNHLMRAINLSGNYDETVIQNEAIWDGVSLHKNGNLLSAITIYEDSSIYVYSFDKQQWMRFMLYNPGTQVGAETFNVLYADAMEWDYSGEYIMYDAYSRVENGMGQSLEFWDVNFIRVWNNQTNDWGDGSIMKLFTGLPEGVSIGNPSFSKNSTHIAAFDMFDKSTGLNNIMAFNLNDGSGGLIYQNGTTLGTPNYSKLDDKLIFTTYYNGHDDIAMIGLGADKVTPSGNPTAFIQDGKWGIWYAQGERAFAVDEKTGDRQVRIFPNPAHDLVTIMVDQMNNETILIELFNLQGQKVFSRTAISRGSMVGVDLSALSKGLYLVRIQGKDFSVSRKITVH